MPLAKKMLRFGAFRIFRIRWVNVTFRRLFKLSGVNLLPMVQDRFPVTGDVRVPLPNGRHVVLRTDGRDTIASRIYWKGVRGHEPETIELYIKLVLTVDVVLDVGASSGLFSLIAAAVNKELTVHAFEPVPETYEFLLVNIAVNLLKNVIPVLACVTDYDGEISVYPNVSPALPFQSSTTRNYQGRTTLREISARAVTLDSYVAGHEKRKIGLLKIDAESSDHLVLEGSTEILARDKPLIICEVLYTDTDHRLEGFFRDIGYRFFRIDQNGLVPRDKVLGDADYVLRNFLFVHESKIDEVRSIPGVTWARLE